MKILFFSLHSGIWNHSYPESLVAYSLKKDHEVYYLTCQRSLKKYCTVMAAFGKKFNESGLEKVCSQCIIKNKALIDTLGFNEIKLSSYLDESDLNKIYCLIEGITVENFMQFTCENVEVGKIILYQFLLNKKRITLDFDESDWGHIQVEILNVLITLYSVKKIISEITFDKVFLYNSLYPVNKVVCELARQNGVEQYFLHAGASYNSKYETLIIGKNNPFVYYERLIEAWKARRDERCTQEEIDFVYGHMASAIEGSSVFSYSSGINSKKIDIRKYFGVSEEQKIVLATMSSSDERFASELVGATIKADDSLFADQIEWIQKIISFFSDQEKMFLVIRVHPREFSNRRDEVVSNNYKLLKKTFKNLPGNVQVNWPEDNISLYHLLSKTTLCLNAWSAAGKEAAILGVPVITFSRKHLVYPDNLCFIPNSLNEYYNLIISIINATDSGNNIRQLSVLAYRWLAFECFRTVAWINRNENEASMNILHKLAIKTVRNVKPGYIERQQCKKAMSNGADFINIRNIISNGLDSIALAELKRSNILNVSAEEAQIKQSVSALKKLINYLFEQDSSASPKLKQGACYETV